MYDDPVTGPTVFHIPVALRAEGVRILDTWRVLGMRGTGSHDVQLDGVFIPDAATGGVRRTPGKWHPFMHTVALVALPIVYSAYVGVAEAARTIALRLAGRKKDDPNLAYIVGEMENEIVTAQLALASAVEMVKSARPGAETTAAALSRRTIVENAVIRAVEKAMEVAGGAGFYREAGLERLLRDAHGARYHPIPEKPQTRLTGRVLLGLDVDG